MNFCLPSDTKIAEYMSALSLMLTAMLSFASGNHYYPGPMVATEPTIFWSMVALIFGSLHLSAMWTASDMRMLRGVLSWFSGSFWTWMALESAMAGSSSLHTLTTMLLGFACYYSFSLNTIVTLRDGPK